MDSDSSELAEVLPDVACDLWAATSFRQRSRENEAPHEQPQPYRRRAQFGPSAVPQDSDTPSLRSQEFEHEHEHEDEAPGEGAEDSCDRPLVRGRYQLR